MKITQEQIEKGQELYEQIVQKAWEDSNFKERLLTNPIETLQNFTGNKVSRDYKVIAEDQTDSNIIYLNIPKKIGLEDIALTEEELDMVSGGGPIRSAFYHIHKGLHEFDLWLGELVFG